MGIFGTRKQEPPGLTAIAETPSFVSSLSEPSADRFDTMVFNEFDDELFRLHPKQFNACGHIEKEDPSVVDFRRIKALTEKYLQLGIDGGLDALHEEVVRSLIQITGDTTLDINFLLHALNQTSVYCLVEAFYQGIEEYRTFVEARCLYIYDVYSSLGEKLSMIAM